MAFKPYNTIDKILRYVKDAKTLDANHPAQKNALLNQFKYKKHVSPENQTIIVKEFVETSYNGPTTNDFIERLSILYDAVKKTIPENQLTELNIAKQITLDKINETCHITPVEDVNELLNKEKDLIKIIDKAKHHLQEFVSKAILLINPEAYKSDTELMNMITVIANDESEVTAAAGRPNFINYYPVKYGKASSKRVSINRVIGDAIPSTERLGSKLPNFVECGVGYMDKDQYVSQFKGYRHSSYTPIKMIDSKYGDSNYELIFGNRKKLLKAVNEIKFERRQSAALCAKDMFAELARQQIAQGANLDKPIEITLSSLAMLSPIKGDKIFMRRGESEHRQLKESYNALMMYNDREIKIKVDGKQITVKPSINIMNVASNWHGIKVSKYLPSTLEKNINAQGMNKYITDTEKYLKLDYISNNITIKNLLKDQVLVKKQLSDLYVSLDQYLNKKTNASTDPAYINLLQSIEKSRNTIDNLENKIFNERIKIINEKKSEIQVFVNSILDKKTGKSKNDEIAELFYQSLFIHMDKKIEPSQFGARYLLVNEKMGHAVDFYCKSGEDRTGRMQNLIEELCEFSKEMGHFPQYDFDKKIINKDDEKIQRTIAKIVSERTVSRDNTDSNARGARGLQITSAVELNTGLPNLSGTKLGTLARGVYDFAAIKKLCRKTLQPLIANVEKRIISGALTMKNKMKQIREPFSVKNRMEQMREPKTVKQNEINALGNKTNK